MVVVSYGSFPETGKQQPLSSTRKWALSALILSALAAAVFVAMIIINDSTNDESVALLAPFEAPKPYKWTGAGEKALKEDISNGVKAAMSKGKEASYKWTGAAMKSLTKSMKNCALCDFPGAGHN